MALEQHDEYFALVRVSEPSGLRPRDLFCFDETQLFPSLLTLFRATSHIQSYGKEDTVEEVETGRDLAIPCKNLDAVKLTLSF